jgi:hypothetical protein
MMDSRVQPITIGKIFAQELWLKANDLVPCSLTIVTFIGHIERTTYYIREPLQLSF